MKNFRKDKLVIGLMVITLVNLFGCKKVVENANPAPSAANEKTAVDKLAGSCPYPCPDARCTAYSIGCPVTGGTIIGSYAGVSITYEKAAGVLSFTTLTDVNTVLDQLDADYENYNAAYESQYPSLTPDQMDSVDDKNNFNEFKTYQDFENKFSGYTTLRSNLLNVENNWLTSNFISSDPDNTDLTFDDSENSLFSSNSLIKIAGVYYQLVDTGLVVSNGGAAAAAALVSVNGVSTNSTGGCFTNRHAHSFLTFGSSRFKLKAAINFCIIRTSTKAKIVCYKQKGGSWKRRRASVNISIYAAVYDKFCSYIIDFLNSNPSSGYKKRKSLKVVRREYYPLKWMSLSGVCHGDFLTPDLAVAGRIYIQ